MKSKSRSKRNAAPRREAASSPPWLTRLWRMARPGAAALGRALRSREAATAYALFAAALAIRLWNLTGLGLSHFDEGPYAGTGRLLVTAPDRFYDAALANSVFAPPLFPWACGQAFRLFGVVDYVAIVPSILAGALTVALVFLLGWRCDRFWTGVWGGVILAVCEFHVMFSRMALTDAMLTFWFTLTVLLGIVAWQKDRWWLYLLPGVAAGLAMNTKYNGFLGLALVMGFYCFAMAWEYGVVPLAVKRRREVWGRPALWRAASVCVGGILGAVGIMALLYAPWYLGVDKTMGYENLLAHHRGYSLGLDRAWADFKGDPGAMLIYFKLWAPVLLLAPLGALAGLWRWRKEHVALYAWAGGMYAALFLYTKYARLALPLTPALAILAGMGVSRLTALGGLAARRWLPVLVEFPRRRVAVQGGLAAVCLAAGVVHIAPTLALDTNSYRIAYQTLQEAYPANRALLVYDTLQNFSFYVDRQAAYVSTNSRMAELLVRPLPKVFVFDQHVLFNREREDFVAANEGVWETVATIPNRHYEPNLWEPFNAAKILAARRTPEKFHRDLNIEIKFTAQPCVIPSSWKSD